VIVVFGLLGDLFESLIKRTIHVKDSGKLIPGHGGLLDRLDTVLMAIPAVSLYLLLI
jgi:phosphatidate cytidylyltransferase